MQALSMIWCAYSTKQQQSQLAGSGLVCCSGCGKVVHQHTFEEESNSINGSGRKVEKVKDRHGACKSTKFDAAKLKGLLHACKTAVGSRDKTNKSRKGSDYSTSLSDVDDAEVSKYLLNKEEKRCKKIIWEKMNLDYIKAQADKKAAAAKAGKLKKERQRQAKSSNKGQVGKRATINMAVKRPSARVDYDALKQLLDEPEASPSNNAKKRKTTSNSEHESTNMNDSHMEDIYGDYGGEEGESGYNDWNDGGDEEYYGDDIF